MPLTLTPLTPVNTGTASAEVPVTATPTVLAEFWAYPSSPGAYPGRLYPSQAGSVIVDGSTRSPGSVSSSGLSSTSQSLATRTPGTVTSSGGATGDLGGLVQEPVGTLPLTPR